MLPPRRAVVGSGGPGRSGGRSSLSGPWTARDPGRARHGGVRERPNRHDWKSCVGKLTVGSNPTASAMGSGRNRIPGRNGTRCRTDRERLNGLAPRPCPLVVLPSSHLDDRHSPVRRFPCDRFGDATAARMSCTGRNPGPVPTTAVRHRPFGQRRLLGPFPLPQARCLGGRWSQLGADCAGWRTSDPTPAMGRGRHR